MAKRSRRLTRIKLETVKLVRVTGAPDPSAWPKDDTGIVGRLRAAASNLADLAGYDPNVSATGSYFTYNLNEGENGPREMRTVRSEYLNRIRSITDRYSSTRTSDQALLSAFRNSLFRHSALFDRVLSHISTGAGARGARGHLYEVIPLLFQRRQFAAIEMLLGLYAFTELARGRYDFPEMSLNIAPITETFNTLDYNRPQRVNLGEEITVSTRLVCVSHSLEISMEFRFYSSSTVNPRPTTANVVSELLREVGEIQESMLEHHRIINFLTNVHMTGNNQGGAVSVSSVSTSYL